MKEWNKPTLSELEIKVTAAPVDVTNMTSSMIAQIDLGTCGNPDGTVNKHWAGNGLSKEEALEENPYYASDWGKDQGGWGAGGGWGSNGGWGSK